MLTSTAALAVSLLCLLLSPFFASSELLGTILVSRHGTRAPNAVTAQLCPANADNIHRYGGLDISLEGVTGRGMLQLYELGQYTKQRYVDSGFLLPYYSNEQMYIRSVGEDRTLQSAVAWGQGLYPAGHAPVNYRSDVPSPLPVYTLPDELDTLLENRKAGCHTRLKEDVAAWDNSTGAAMQRQYSALLGQLEALCGVDLARAVNGSGDNYGDAIKDITDLWTFDFIEHFPPQAGLTLDQLLQFRTYAVAQLIGRILGTVEQVTYMNGDLPVSMLRSFEALIDQAEGNDDEEGEGKPHRVDIGREVKPLKFIAYHGHREMMYALAAFFDIQFNISYPALPLGAIPPATSLFFELHREGAGKHEDDYVVKAVLWTPCDDEAHTQPDTPLVTLEREHDEQPHTVNVTGHNHTHSHNASRHHNHTQDASNHTSSHPKHHAAHTAHTHTHTTSSSRAGWSAGGQCGGRVVDIGRCEGGTCSFDEFRAVILAQINRTGSWHTLCHSRQHSERYNHSASHSHDGSDVDTKVAGAGKTEDHSPGYGATEGSGEEEKGKVSAHGHKHHGHNATHVGHNATHAHNGTHAAHGKEKSGSSGWTVLLWVLVFSAVVGGLGYWYFVVRPGNRDRSEYRPVPGRP